MDDGDEKEHHGICPGFLGIKDQERGECERRCCNYPGIPVHEFLPDKVDERDGQYPEQCGNEPENRFGIPEDQHQVFSPVKQGGVELSSGCCLPDIRD